MAKVNPKSGIKSWPLDDRPREKLLKKGAGALSNSELLAILLRTGTNGTSAVEIRLRRVSPESSKKNEPC